jgi:shikimate kinase
MLSFPRPLALVGMPGCGKSSVGALLAQALTQVFLDNDTEIEKASGLTIPLLFSKHGEAVFRRYERWMLRCLVQRYPQAVLATGGGAFAEHTTRAFLQANTLTFWIDVPLDVLQERLHDDTQRPLLTGDKAATLTRLDASRRPLYAQAHQRIDGNAAAPVVAHHLLEILHARYA